MATMEELKNAIEEFARTIPSGSAREYPGFSLFRRKNTVGAAIPTGETLINIHVPTGQSFRLEGDAAVPGVEGNFLTLTVDVSDTDLNDPLKADAFSNMVLQFVATKNGNRERLVANPWAWASTIIEMNGDTATKTRPYPYIAELYLVAALRDAGLLNRFAAVVCGDEVDRGKPDPQIFLRCCEKMGGIPSDTFVLEDSYNGIRAAHAAGMRAIMVPDLLEATPEMEHLAQCICPDLAAAGAEILRRAEAGRE